MSLCRPSLFCDSDITISGGEFDTTEILVIGAMFSLSSLLVETIASGLGDAAAVSHLARVK